MHPVLATQTFIKVILPVALPKPYTYIVPEEWVSKIRVGQRVEVQFGKGKHYTALVAEILNELPADIRPKPILSILDEEPIIHPIQLQLWNWVADYYACTLGEVMHAALPANLKLVSDTQLVLSPLFDRNFEDLNDKEYLIAEALTIQEEISIEDVRKILNQKTVYPLIKRMLEKKIVYLKEDLKTKYKPKKVIGVRLQEPYRSQPELLEDAFEKLSRSNRQVEALMAYIELSRKKKFIRKQDIYDKAKVDGTVLKAMVKKGVFELEERKISRVASYEEELVGANQLSDQQQEALVAIKQQFEHQNTVLLHGVTGSGKTRVYMELMQEVIDQGKQVLYLLPEIALTTQIIERLQKVFGDKIAVYHSRLNNNERVDLWNEILAGKPIILGARSALFLPFAKIGLIIVDEEHDPSFKQQEPNPRYNARDAATYLAHLHQAKVVLGTATPAIESFFNTKTQKYGLVEMPERFGGLELPETIIVDAKKDQKGKTGASIFTPTLIEALKTALEAGEQAILFQNRRGFSPTYRCTSCGWNAECIHCDVSLTYHKYHNNLKCHYCGYQTKLPVSCAACGSRELRLMGFGTEKVEDELKIFLPEARIGRMDLDTVRSKHAHAKIINDFEEGRIEILVGTQMVTKGLDFGNVAVVGVLSADQLLHFPDFRSAERAFQLMVQVSGRAGRRQKRGKVIIQTYNPTHPVIQEVLQNDFAGFYKREIQERQAFKYPPFVRLIKISLKHKKPEVLNDATKIFSKFLKEKLGSWVIGPAIPYISRIRSYYLMDFIIKLDKDAKKIRFAKATIADAKHHLQQTSGFSGVRVTVDVDPN